MKMMICLGLMMAVISPLAYSVNLMANDAIPTSSFNTAGHWDNGLAPSAGNSYVTQGYLLRTPSMAGNYTFAGDQLVVGQGNGGGSNPFLTNGQVNSNCLLNRTLGNPVITVNDLVLDLGYIRDGLGSANTWTLAGNINVTSAGGLACQCRFNIDSTISGSGPLYIATNGTGEPARTIYINSPYNTYNGSIILLGADAAHSRLTFSAGSRMNFVIGASGLCNSISGTGTATFGGVFSFDLSAAGTTVGDSWTIASVTSQTFGGTFSVEGFTDMGGGLWRAGANGVYYHFSTSTGKLTVPFSGSGTALDPYQIWTSQQMNMIGADSSYWDKRFKLMVDIDMSDYTGTQYNIIGNLTTYFTGAFDGNGHSIANVTINQPGVDGVGLFGCVGSGGQVKNLDIVNANVTGQYGVGGLCGGNFGGTITECYATGAVTGSGIVGGLCGRNMGTISQCYATGAATGDIAVGGLCGGNYSGTISQCYSTGTVTATNEHAGGLCGGNYGTISQCYATGAVTGSSSVGGLCGHNDYYSTITECYATGAVTGSSSVGGLCGSNYEGTIIECYATGTAAGSSDVGGLCGYNYYGTITDCFWDTQTSGQPTSSGGAGKTTVQMKTVSTFTAAGWDFVDLWGIGNGQAYPYLKPLTGFNFVDINYSGTVDLEDLAILAANWLK